MALRRILAALMAIVLTAGMLIVPAAAEEGEEAEPEAAPGLVAAIEEEVRAEAAPGEDDFTFSKGIITGLKAQYLGGLTAEQRQNIHLVFPGTIGGSPVTKIGDRAFQGGTETRYVSVDFSASKNLDTIGSDAFSGNPYMSGDLILPDSLTTLGGNAFNGCRGFDGTLKLPDNAGFTKILSQTFLYCGFSGVLAIPDTVTAIGSSAFRIDTSQTGFSGALVIPDSVTLIEKSAFSGQKGLTSVRVPSGITQLNEGTFQYCSGLRTVTFSPGSALTSIETSCFNEAGTNAVAYLPPGLKALNGNAFYYSGFQTVYLPKGIESISSSSFSGCNSLTALVCDKDDYARLSGLSFTNKGKLGYPITVSFRGGDEAEYPQLERLFNQPLNVTEGEDGAWRVDGGFRLPELAEGAGEKRGWAFSETGLLPLGAGDPVKGETLYAIRGFEDPVITYGPGIDKEYDGEPSVLTATAAHPMAKPIDSAGEGDVVFYYTWSWYTIGGSPDKTAGFDLSSYDVGDVRADYEIACGVTVQACVVRSGKAVVFYQTSHDFSVSLRKGTPTVTPVCQTSGLRPGDGLPGLRTQEGCVPGTIAWDEGQTLAQGTHSYRWTFTPEKNAEGQCNYNVVQGALELTATVPSTGGSGGGSTTKPPKTESQTDGDVKTETTTTSTTNKDGSKTTEVLQNQTNTATGEKTESKVTETVAKDGSVTREETRVTTAADGTRTEEKTSVAVDAGTGTAATTTVRTDGTGKSTAHVVVENGKDAKVVTVSADAVKAAAQADEVTMTVKTAGAEIVLDAGAVAAVAGARGEVVSIAVGAVGPETLPEKARGPLRDAVVMDLSIRVGEDRIASFNGGTATVAVPYARTDSTKAVAVLYVDDAGGLTRMPGASYNDTAQSVVFTTGHFSYYAVKEEVPLAYTDVKDGDWHYGAVRYVTEQSLFAGTSASTFGPDEPMTREMLSTVLWRRAGGPTGANPLTGYEDGPLVSEWAVEGMKWAVDAGILTGVGGQILAPQGAVTRQQLAVLLYRAAGNPQADGTALSAYHDGGRVAGWAEDAMAWAVRGGILAGRGDGTLDPAGTASRAEVAAMLERLAAQ